MLIITILIDSIRYVACVIIIVVVMDVIVCYYDYHLLFMTICCYCFI